MLEIEESVFFINLKYVSQPEFASLQGNFYHYKKSSRIYLTNIKLRYLYITCIEEIKAIFLVKFLFRLSYFKISFPFSICIGL